MGGDGKRESRKYSRLGGNHKRGSSNVFLFFGEGGGRGKVLLLLLTSPVFFSFGDYGTMRLPSERAATCCNDPNTAAWRRDWLREESKGAEPGCRAAPPNPHID